MLNADGVFCYGTLETAMLTAAMCNHAECIPLLLAAKNPCKLLINGQETTRITPLMVAAAFGGTEVGQMLEFTCTLYNCYDITASVPSPAYGVTPEKQSSPYQSIDLSRFLLQAVRALLEAGANVNAISKGSQRLTALHLVAKSGDAEIANISVEHGACVSMCAADSYTAAQEAHLTGHAVLAKVLAPPPTTSEVSRLPCVGLYLKHDSFLCRPEANIAAAW